MIPPHSHSDPPHFSLAWQHADQRSLKNEAQCHMLTPLAHSPARRMPPSAPARPFPRQPHMLLVPPDNGEGTGGSLGRSARSTARPWIPHCKQDLGQPFGLVFKINNVTQIVLCACVCVRAYLWRWKQWSRGWGAAGLWRCMEVCGSSAWHEHPCGAWAYATVTGWLRPSYMARELWRPALTTASKQSLCGWGTEK